MHCPGDLVTSLDLRIYRLIPDELATAISVFKFKHRSQNTAMLSILGFGWLATAIPCDFPAPGNGQFSIPGCLSTSCSGFIPLTSKLPQLLAGSACTLRFGSATWWNEICSIATGLVQVPPFLLQLGPYEYVDPTGGVHACTSVQVGLPGSTFSPYVWNLTSLLTTGTYPPDFNLDVVCTIM